MDEWLVRIGSDWHAHERLRVEVGIDNANIDTLYYEEENEDTYDWPAETRQRSAYLQMTWQAAAALTFDLGARTIRNELTDTDDVEPRLAASARLGANVSLRAAWGKYSQHVLRSPDTLNYFWGIKTWFLAQENIQPGRAEHWVLGSRIEWDTLLLDIEAYRRDFSGNISKLFDPTRPDGGAYQTAGWNEGIDLHLEKAFGPHRLQLAYAYLNTRVTENISYEIPLDYVTDTDRPHTLKLLGQAHLGSWLTVGSWTYASGLPYSVPGVGLRFDEHGARHYYLTQSRDPNGQRLDDNHQLDLSLRYRFSMKTVQGEIGIAVTNIYDQDNAIYRYYVLDRHEAVPVDVKGLGATWHLQMRLNF